MCSSNLLRLLRDTNVVGGLRSDCVDANPNPITRNGRNSSQVAVRGTTAARIYLYTSSVTLLDDVHEGPSDKRS
jgi:hypothetical protein